MPIILKNENYYFVDFSIDNCMYRMLKKKFNLMNILCIFGYY